MFKARLSNLVHPVSNFLKGWRGSSVIEHWPRQTPPWVQCPVPRTNKGKIDAIIASLVCRLRGVGGAAVRMQIEQGGP